MATPLFAQQGTMPFGLSGILAGQQIQENFMKLDDMQRQRSRDHIAYASELQMLDAFAGMRANGASPSDAYLAMSQSAMNPLVGKYGMNNFVDRNNALGPVALEAAQQGNTGMINSLMGGTGFQFNPSTPGSGYSAFGANGLQATNNAQQQYQALGVPFQGYGQQGRIEQRTAPQPQMQQQMQPQMLPQMPPQIPQMLPSAVQAPTVFANTVGQQTANPLSTSGPRVTRMRNNSNLISRVVNNSNQGVRQQFSPFPASNNSSPFLSNEPTAQRYKLSEVTKPAPRNTSSHEGFNYGSHLRGY